MSETDLDIPQITVMQEGPVVTDYTPLAQPLGQASPATAALRRWGPCTLQRTTLQPLFGKPQRGLGLDSSQGMFPLGPDLGLHSTSLLTQRALLKATAPLCP